MDNLLLWVLLLVFLVLGVYYYYNYYKKQQEVKDVNNNLQNVESVKQDHHLKFLNNKQQQPQQLPDFVPSETFKGEQKGYVFQKRK